jgi:peptidyl serine alpha-galactosyltransferase
MHTVFSTDGSLYQRWQADLLAYSYRKVDQPGPLTRLYSAWNTPSTFDGQTFQTEPYSPHPTTNDDYPPYNRIGALLSWLKLSSPPEETLLILDPDCIFITAFDEAVECGRPIAQWIAHLDTSRPKNAELLKRHGFREESVQLMGIPLLIHREDLRVVLPLWMEKTEEIRNDPISRELSGWVAEMWGYVFAAAQLGLRHELRFLAHKNDEDESDKLPFIHYCHPSASARGQWQWHKWLYRAWDPVPEPPPDVPAPTVPFISLLNEFAQKQGHRILQE